LKNRGNYHGCPCKFVLIAASKIELTTPYSEFVIHNYIIGNSRSSAYFGVSTLLNQVEIDKINQAFYQPQQDDNLRNLNEKGVAKTQFHNLSESLSLLLFLGD
jgi:hypothetical protein